MALKMQLDTRQGVTLPEAYLKVTAIAYNARATTNCTANVTTYASAQARQDNKEAITSSSVAFAYDMDSPDNLLVQAYTAIKARPEFAGAVDC